MSEGFFLFFFLICRLVSVIIIKYFQKVRTLAGAIGLPFAIFAPILSLLAK